MRRLAPRSLAIWPLGVVLSVVGCEEPREPIVYQSVPVLRRDITVTVEAAGVIEPEVTVEVKSKTSGEILQMLVETGDRIEEPPRPRRGRRSSARGVRSARRDERSSRARRRGGCERALLHRNHRDRGARRQRAPGGVGLRHRGDAARGALRGLLPGADARVHRFDRRGKATGVACGAPFLRGGSARLLRGRVPVGPAPRHAVPPDGGRTCQTCMSRKPIDIILLCH